MTTLTIKGREIPLVYTVYEMKSIQEEIAPLGDIQYVICGRNMEDDNDTSKYASPEHLNAVTKLIRILGNAGLEESGETPDLKDKWIMRSLRPMELPNAINTCIRAMSEGMATETPKEEKKKGPVDVVLEEIEEKKEQDD